MKDVRAIFTQEGQTTKWISSTYKNPCGCLLYSIHSRGRWRGTIVLERKFSIDEDTDIDIVDEFRNTEIVSEKITTNQAVWYRFRCVEVKFGEARVRIAK